ncbi:MAG: hypothetical protein F6K17_33915 [Okeania sp. SIO3C4]|nr:hypothetical protein [Okeania sp. SIO3B3]NER07220.1 hypothetical protein [Okeania sp. SIO3C4]
MLVIGCSRPFQLSVISYQLSVRKREEGRRKRPIGGKMPTLQTFIGFTQNIIE